MQPAATAPNGDRGFHKGTPFIETDREKREETGVLLKVSAAFKE